MSNRRYPKLPQSQAGVVLVVVVAAVVMLLILLATMIEDQHILIRRIANQKVSEQGFQYAQGVNAWAARVLHEDQNRDVDYLGEDWAKFGRPEPEASEDESGSFSLRTSNRAAEEEKAPPTIDFDFDGLEYSIDDLQARFNLNNLSVVDKKTLAGQKRILLNLFELLEIGEFDQRQQLVENIVDWVDENDTSALGISFESGDYAVKPTPYFAADQKLTSLGELKFVEGFDDDIIRKIKPYVTVLPVENARININTVSPELLASLSSGVVTNPESVQPFLAAREEKAFLGFQPPQIEQAKDAIISASATSSPPVVNMMQVKSQFFQINAKVTMGDYVYCMQSTVLREGAGPAAGSDALSTPKVTVLSRQHNTLCEDESPIVPDNNEDLS